ncbi:MAG: radical SAM protein [Methanobrevibacter sp.]|nr:radical SAM protein [Methanobrevibacter sp.]
MLFNEGNIPEIVKKYSFKTKEVKSILNKSKGKRSFFMEDYTLNPYMGCQFDCSYCYINGSKYANNTNEYYIKVNAYQLLKTQLKNKLKKEERGVIMVGSASDPYMPIEEELFLTRDILKLIERYKFAVHIITKSDLILRDIDILKKIRQSAILPNDIKDERLKTIISFSFSTVDDEIANIFEINAPKPSKRLRAIKKLKKQGFLVGVSLMPLLPFISDTEEALNEMMKSFKDAGVDYTLPGGLTLFGNENEGSKGCYYKKLKEFYPEHLEKTKELFVNNDYPKESYFKEINERVRKIANEYGIMVSIV